MPQESPTACNKVAALLFCLVVFLNAAPADAQSHPTLVSVNGSGTGSGNRRSGDFGRYRISADGKFAVFYSEASNLVPLDTSQNGDIFVRNLQTGVTTLVSVNAAGTASGNGISIMGLISADGRYVAFSSHSNNLVPTDTNTSNDVFLRDLQTGTTKLVSINLAGTNSGSLAGSDLIDMSPDGRFITFASGAQNLTAQPDANGLGSDIYVRDMLTNTTTLVSVNSAGSATGNGTSFGGSISSDGRYVVFTSQSSDLVANDTATRDVFLRDLHARQTIRLSTNVSGTGGGNNESQGGVINRTGRVVVFATRATDLSALPDTNDLADIFIYDIQAGTKRLITVNTAGTATGGGFVTPGFFDHGFQFSISEDGSFVAFMSQLRDLVSNDTNGSSDDVFLYNVATQAKTLVSVNLSGTSGAIGGSSAPSISADGRFVAFQSLANDLTSVADETGGFTNDVFVRDMVAGQTYLASLNNAGTRTGNGFSFEPFINPAGTLVFNSRASDLVANDLNAFEEDVFMFTAPNSSVPVILTEENTDRAVALDSVIQTRDPFAIINPLNFSSDQRTRVSLFVWRLDLFPNEASSAVTATAEEGQGTIHLLEVESVKLLPNYGWIKQVVVKLPASVNAPTDLRVQVTLRGIASNKAVIRIKP